MVDRVRALENVALPVPSGEMSTRVVRQATTAKRVPREGRRGDFGLAKSFLEKLVSLDPSNPNISQLTQMIKNKESLNEPGFSFVSCLPK